MIADSSLQQTTANADQIKEVEERVQSLGGILAYPVGDQDREEKARRDTLKRFVLPHSRDTGNHSAVLFIRRKLAKVIAKLGPLSQQNGIAKFLKNVDHADILNGLVRDLAYALTDYQVWDGNPIVGAV